MGWSAILPGLWISDTFLLNPCDDKVFLAGFEAYVTSTASVLSPPVLPSLDLLLLLCRITVTIL